MAKRSKKRRMTVQCGSLLWRGLAVNTDDAIIAALAEQPPKNPSELLRIFDRRWYYIDFKSALKVAGYRVVEIPELEGGGFYID